MKDSHFAIIKGEKGGRNSPLVAILFANNTYSIDIRSIRFLVSQFKWRHRFRD